MKRRIALVLAGALLLSWIASSRTEGFSLKAISGPLFADGAPPLTPESAHALSQPYRFLGKGRQSYVFASLDGKTVLKFFIQKYHQLPWYEFLLSEPRRKKERAKRQLRERFYRQSYLIAASALAEECGLLYGHFGPSPEKLPILTLTDKAHRRFFIDLNAYPFVLQKRGKPLYPSLGTLKKEEVIEAFFTQISHRIEQGIADADHDVEHNFGVLDGQLLHLDPGRLFLDKNLKEPQRFKQEWWSATHRFRNWLQEHHPEQVSFFDARLEAHKTSSLQALQGSQSVIRLT